MIKALSKEFPVIALCALFAVSRSRFYEWLKGRKSDRELADETLLIEIRKVFHEHKKRYGSPRICRELKARDRVCSQKRVARLMRKNGLSAKPKRAFRPKTTVRAKDDPIAPNRLEETLRHQGVVWVSDVTYIRTRKRWLYPAAVMDYESREIISWKLGRSLCADLVVQTLDKAVRKQAPSPDHVFHSDRRSQYASANFYERLEDLRILPSMGRTGCCFDNAAMESFWSTLKCEMLPRSGCFADYDTANLAIFEYIDIYYNRKRRHSALNYLSPFEFKEQLNNNYKSV